MHGFVLSVSVLGYTIPLVVIVTILAIVIGSLLTVVFSLTIGVSVYRSIARSRRDRVQPELRTELLNRLFAETPHWDEWVRGLTTVERDVVESLLDEHLRELDGADADRLRELGDALGIPGRAGQRLEKKDEYTRLHALTWLTLLRQPSPYLESSFEPETPRERAAVVTLLHTTDRLSDTATGVSILLEGLDTQFSVFGQNTLYHIARTDPAPLLQTANDAYDEWSEPLLGQVLAVCAHLETSVRDGELAWLTAVLESGTEATRAGAADALASFGWRRSLRDGLFLKRAINDPSPRVRAAVYRMLATWGDDAALTALREALVDESDRRALTVGTAALVGRRDRLDFDPGMLFGDAWKSWKWSVEHAEYDQLARQADREPSRG